MAGTVVGQPPRKRLKVDDDPFGAVGDYVGSFLIKSAVEVSGGYETNPGRLPAEPTGRAVLGGRAGISRGLRLGASRAGRRSPGLVHRLWQQPAADVRRRDLRRRRPMSTGRVSIGHIDGRLDVTENTHLTAEVRLLVSTDNPGSPNIQAGLASYPIYTTLGGTFGVDQNFNRLDLAAAPPSTAPSIRTPR